MYFFRKYRERILVFVIAITLIVIVGYTNKDRIGITKVEKVIGSILSPVSKVSLSVGNKVTNFFASITNVFTSQKENEELRAKITQLESENRDLTNIIGKTEYLKNELKIMESSPHKLLLAQITGKEPGNWYDRFDIDKGLKDGVNKGDTIVQGIEIEQNVFQEGIIGRVADVGPNWAKVISVIDELNSVSFKIIRTQDGGMLSGNRDSSLNGYLFDHRADVIVGDKLYTSGLGETYIKDIYIGEVIEVISDEEELIKKLVIKPAIDFKKIYKVYVIIN